jgi:hypothetical protein
LPLLLLTLAGCSGHYLDTMASAHALARDGRSADAFVQLKARTDGTQWDALLVALDKGALLHRSQRWAESAEALNHAIELAEERETVRVGEEVFGRAPFRMANHEKQALHALQAINYLMLGKSDDAVVEARLTDLRQRRLQAETELSADSERFVTGSTVDEKQREFFEQLVFGRYVSGLARERSGDEPGAFIDYWRAVTLMRGAPADARIELAHLGPKLLRLAEKLQRPELDEVRRFYGGVAPEPMPGNEGEVVLLVEQGFAPLAVLDPELRAYKLVASTRDDKPLYAILDGPVVPEVVSSIEELATRRGYRGLLIDRERSATIGVNTVLFVGFLLVWPVGMPLLIKRSWETTMRDGQSWALLPAEFAVARVRLPPGKHKVKVPGLTGLTEREVEVVKGQITVLTAEGP